MLHSGGALLSSVAIKACTVDCMIDSARENFVNSCKIHINLYVQPCEVPRILHTSVQKHLKMVKVSWSMRLLRLKSQPGACLLDVRADGLNISVKHAGVSGLQMLRAICIRQP